MLKALNTGDCGTKFKVISDDNEMNAILNECILYFLSCCLYQLKGATEYLQF